MIRFVIALCVFAARAALASDPTGIWVGGTTALGDPIFVQADFARGTLEVPSQDATVALKDIKADASKISFTVDTPYGLFEFSGAVDGFWIRGSLKTPLGKDATLHLRRTDTTDASALAGVYRADDGEYLLLTARPNGQLRMIGTNTLSSTRLVRIEGGRFIEAGSIVRDPAAAREFRFPQRVDLIEEERVRFRNEGVELAGTLFKPRGKGPHATAVVVHGSGAVSRDLLLLRAQLLIRRGIAVLLYDKRGTGESTGDWRFASFSDLAGDALAAIRYLRTRDDVDALKLGVVGHSQAGWILPIVTSRDDALAFSVILSGGAISPEEQEIFRAETQTRDDFPNANALQAKELMKLTWRYARTGEGWSEYERAWQKATSEPWFRNIAGPRTPDDPQWQQVRVYASYDPLPYLQTIRVPTLVVLGADDENHPTSRAASIWRSALRDGEVVVVRNAGHNLMIRQKDDRFIYAPDYVEAVEKFLRKRGLKLTKLF